MAGFEFQKRRSYARIQGLIDRYGRKGKLDPAAPDDPGGTRVVATAGSGS